MSKRFKPDVRKAAILDVALRLAEKSHYTQVQRKQIADELGVTPPAITYHYNTMAQLQRAMVRAAMVSENVAVVAQALISKDPHAAGCSEGLKKKALESALS